METKVSAYPLKDLDEKGTGIAVIATKHLIDKDADVTLDGAFGEQMVPVMPAHDWRQAPLGKAKLSETTDEVLAHFRLNLKTTLGRDWYEAFKFDLENPPAKTEWSYGFTALDAEPGEKDGQRVRYLKRLQAHEISGVLLGSGVGTRTVALKEENKRWLTVEQVERLCPPCAEKMRASGITKVALAELAKRLDRKQFQCPKPFSFDECVEKFRGDPDVDDPEAFCAAWAEACGEKGATMAEQLTASVAGVKATVARLEEIRVLRAKDGRGLSEERRVALAEVRGLLVRIDEMLKEGPASQEAVRRYYALKEKAIRELRVE